MAMVVVQGSLGAEDWPQWRGPNADGKSTETNLLKAWPTGGPELAWQVAGLGAGFSGVTLVGDAIYTSGEFEEASQVLALNREDGRRRWSAPLGQAGAPGWGRFAGPRSSVSVPGARLYALGHSDSKGWTLQDLKSGAAIWQNEELLGKGSISVSAGPGPFVLLRRPSKVRP